MKTKFKGTPGKWKTYKGNDRWVVRGGNIVAVVHDGTRDGSRGWEDQDIIDANVRLIAAAPELLEALQKTNDLLKDLDNTHTGDSRYADFAIQYSENRKLIEKALGI